jgi:GWxTD domain-containing protein
MLRSPCFPQFEVKTPLHISSIRFGSPARLAALILCLTVLSLSPLATAPAFAANSEKNLAPTYRRWIHQEVNYIITRAEKNEFLELKTDEERDKFIERFWELRNTTPGAPGNPYKEEHYKRLEYANDHFSNNSAHDGWNTDMGRIYITLGPPQQKGRYVAQSEVRGMEIWFYSQANPALPPNFNIVFYEKDFGDFRLYSPYMDGPNKLVSSHFAEDGRVQSVLEIDHILGREVALTTLSLIPGEPVNINDANSTLQSDLMLGTIKDLANHPFNIEALNLKRAMKESVSHRVVLPGEFLNVLTVPLRDRRGFSRLNYVLRLNSASDFAVAKADDRYYISLEVSAHVFTADHKPLFQRDRKIARYLTKDQLEEVKGKPFGYEDWLPLAPGKYKVEFALTNLLGETSFTAEREVVMPSAPTEGFTITEIVPFTEVTPMDPAVAAVLPFSSGGVKFTPYAGKDLALVPGQDLKVFYQIWSVPAAPGSNAGKKLLADYAYGRPGITGTAKSIHDEAAKEQFDESGSMINGKRLTTEDLDPGNYRMALTVTDPETREKRFGAIAFHVVNEAGSQMDAWDIYDDKLADYVNSGEADYDFGVTCLAQDDRPTASRALQEALRKNPKNDLARARLVDIYFSQQAYDKVIQLYSQPAVTPSTEDQTIIRLSDSFDKTGNTKKAADIVESAIALKPESGPLYLALASYYQRLGNAQKAEQLERKGKSLLVTPPPSL